MLVRPFALRRNDILKRSRSRTPRIECMESRVLLSPPTVTGLAPTSGSEAGGTFVTISGTSFTGATAVDFGTTAATNLSILNDTTITADSPSGTGVVNVTVTAPGGTSAVSPADEFTYTVPAAPDVTGVSPNSGPAAGGTLVTITGTSFTGATVVDFGTTAATNPTVVNDTTITADSPAGTGTVDVTVTTPVGTSATSPADQFTYIAAPTVTVLSPTSGTTAGGTPVTITGTGFTGATAVDFGPTAATNVSVVSATSITADSPAGTGTVDVTVTTPGGTSPTSSADQFTYTAAVAPAVTGVTPATGSTAGGTPVTISGSGFSGATLVDFGANAATDVKVINDDSITAVSPAGTGTVDVTVTTPVGTSPTSPADQFVYTAAVAPTVTALSPATGSQAGGNLVTITGTSFTGATAVDFGPTAATNVTVVNDSTITADSPAGTGTVNVTVMTAAGTSPTAPANQFTYEVAAAPSVTGLIPTSGPTFGGTAVTISGTNLTGATAVDFGTVPATNVTVVSDTSITADSPAGTGTVDVTVTTPSGTSATSPADQFTYSVVAAPTVTGLSPTSGPPSGGTLVTLTGTGFTGATAVNFGTTAATNVTVVSATSITADSPAGTGVVNVTVTTPGGTSAASPADEFTYAAAAAPVVTGVSPNTGPTTGGTLVTITGTSFTGATAVDFGTTAATNVTVVNDTTVTADSPAGSVGTVDVTVTTPVGTSATSPADQFTYAVAAAPTVTAISPTGGPTAGGTVVTITGTSFTGATAVDFGTTPATNVTVVSSTSITADSPAGTGTANVTVTTPFGTSATSSADQFTYAAAVAAPTVVSLVRFGFHMQPTSLVLTFSSALDPTPAQNVNNYQIVDSQGVAIPVSSAVYDASALTVTLNPSQLLSLQQSYMLTVTGTPPNGLTSSTGVPIDGADNGTSGTNFVTTFSGTILAGPAPELLRTNARRYAAEARLAARFDRSPGADSHRLAATQKHQAAAGRKIAAQARKVVVQGTLRLAATQKHQAAQASKAVLQGELQQELSSSAVDQLMGADPVSVSTFLKRNRGAFELPLD